MTKDARLDGVTHSAECWRWHPECCKERMERIAAEATRTYPPGDNTDRGWNAAMREIIRITRGGVE